MARYEDGGIEFAQEQFAKARDYREEQAKKQEKFAKRLQMANLAVSGVNFALNQKADQLELDRITERSNLLNTLESAKSWTNRYNKYVEEGLTEEQMYKKDLAENAFNYLEEKYEGYEDVRAVFGDAVENAVSKVGEMPNARTFEEWKKTNDFMLKIPSLSQQDLIEVIKKDGGAPPRNIGAFLGNSVRNFFRAHDEETLKNADNKAAEQMLTGPLGDKFGAATEALRQWKQKGNALTPLKNYLETEEGKGLISKLSKDEKVTMSAQKLVNSRTGISTSTPVMIVSGRTPTEGFGRIEDKTQLMTDLTTTIIDEVPVTPQELSETESISRLYITSTRISDNALQAYKDLDIEEQGQLEGFNRNLIATTRNILQENPTISKNKAIEIATEYYLLQGQGLTHLKPSLFDIAKIDKTIQIDTEDRNQIVSFIDSIKRTQPEYAVASELKDMQDVFATMILTSKEADWKKESELKALNQLFKDEANLEPFVKTDTEQADEIDKTLTEFQLSRELGQAYLEKWNERENLKMQALGLKPKNLFARWTMSIAEKEETFKEYNAFVKLHGLDVSDSIWARNTLKELQQ